MSEFDNHSSDGGLDAAMDSIHQHDQGYVDTALVDSSFGTDDPVGMGVEGAGFEHVGAPSEGDFERRQESGEVIDAHEVTGDEPKPKKSRLNTNFVAIGVGVLFFVGMVAYNFLLSGAPATGNDMDLAQSSGSVSDQISSSMPLEQVPPQGELVMPDGQPSPEEQSAGVGPSADVSSQQPTAIGIAPPVAKPGGQPTQKPVSAHEDVAALKSKIEEQAKTIVGIEERIAGLEAEKSSLKSSLASTKRDAVVKKASTRRPKESGMFAKNKKPLASVVSPVPPAPGQQLAPAAPAPRPKMVLKAVTPGQAWIEADGVLGVYQVGDSVEGDVVSQISPDDRLVRLASGRILK